MNGNAMRQTLRQGGGVIGTSVVEFGTPGVARVLAAADIDVVGYDMEHTGFGIDTIWMLMAAARAVDQIALVRPPANLPHLIGPILDTGAHGIIAPMVETADDAALALDVIGAVFPELVIMDVDLPGISGLELLDRLRRHPAPRVATVPVLLMSAGQHQAEADRRGVPFLDKPIDLDDALAAAEWLLRPAPSGPEVASGAQARV